MSKVYKTVVVFADRLVPSKLRPLWEHEAGPKTIFFWAPAFKWGLVLAGLGDLQRPVETLSIPQSASLAATGIIWSRYSLALVAVSVDEYRRPLDSVSPTQSATLAATGLIWTRYCLRKLKLTA
ncbi:unnamed protein product [Pieris brassicae]|uniref:Mitochondrial pyruvate carrier n=1 Tax=Pieris brassicae TaxID=7116 RepID=A0A9P0TI71_PIEBR|nr:unnamed protein product [Pieris brassicae]